MVTSVARFDGCHPPSDPVPASACHPSACHALYIVARVDRHVVQLLRDIHAPHRCQSKPCQKAIQNRPDSAIAMESRLLLHCPHLSACSCGRGKPSDRLGGNAQARATAARSWTPSPSMCRQSSSVFVWCVILRPRPANSLQEQATAAQRLKRAWAVLIWTDPRYVPAAAHTLFRSRPPTLLGPGQKVFPQLSARAHGPGHLSSRRAIGPEHTAVSYQQKVPARKRRALWTCGPGTCHPVAIATISRSKPPKLARSGSREWLPL